MIPRLTAWANAGVVLAVVLVVDQVTKRAALAGLGPTDRVDVFFGLELRLVRNRGIAFGVLPEGGWPVTAMTVGALALLLAYFVRHAGRPGLWLPVGALMGGALGNLADRAREGSVIDYIDPAFWPAFNLADTAIVLGVLALLYVIEGPDPEPAPVRGDETPAQ